MSSHTTFWILEIIFGFWLAVHCSRQALRQLRNDIAIGLSGEYSREAEPFSFWTTIVVTALTGLMGLWFIVFGVAAIQTGGNTIGEVLDGWAAKEPLEK